MWLMAMQRYTYGSYKDYLITQYRTNIDRKFITHLKHILREEDIKNIASAFSGRRCLCLGCRDDIEVDDFLDNGFEARGIDILPTKNQVQGDFNRLDEYFQDASFDIAYSCHTLEHTYELIKVLVMIRRICIEGVYLVLPIRSYADEEEPVFLEVMETCAVEDLNELEPGLGKFEVLGRWVRDDHCLPSGPEVAFALKWC